MAAVGARRTAFAVRRDDSYADNVQAHSAGIKRQRIRIAQIAQSAESDQH
jgi:hypothetical protein